MNHYSRASGLTLLAILFLVMITGLFFPTATPVDAGGKPTKTPTRTPTPTPTSPPPAACLGSYTCTRLSNPDRIQVSQSGNWVATFTIGSRTVTMAGPQRTFTEPGTAGQGISIAHATWVRTYPTAFQEPINEAWFNAARTANTNNVPDLLQIGMQYVNQAPAIMEGSLQIAGDACYGNAAGADFNDYLGVTWNYPAPDIGSDPPEANEFRCMDCSGFTRMIFGYRHSFAGGGYSDQHPLSWNVQPDHVAIPRHSYTQCDSGPGVLVVPNSGGQITDFSKLQIGDLVCFDASDGDGQIDHVGMFMGIDNAGHYRMINSRNSLLGPTIGDSSATKSILDGTGLYATSFRIIRRY